MNCHQGKVTNSVRVRLSFDSKDPFPEKLYDVANNGYLVKWNGCGTAVQVDDPDLFEKEVMKCYPGFLQIPSFVNFRRLFREYSFDWKFLDDGQTFEFSHPYFVYGYRDVVSEIRTRRKSFSKPTLDISAFQKEVNALENENDEDGKRYNTRRSRRTKTRKSLEIENRGAHHSEDYTNNSRFVINDSLQDGSSNDSYSSNQPTKPDNLNNSSVDNNHYNSSNTFSSVASDIMKLFIKNEFSFEDFCTWTERNQCDFNLNANKWDILESVNNQSQSLFTVNNTSHALFTTNDGYSNSSQISYADPQLQEDPCGNCKCCRAYQISHYENISSQGLVSRNMSVPGELDLSCDDAPRNMSVPGELDLSCDDVLDSESEKQYTVLS